MPQRSKSLASTHHRNPVLSYVIGMAIESYPKELRHVIVDNAEYSIVLMFLALSLPAK